MLRDPNNPNHHKYTSTNKYQRKKQQSKDINVVVIFKNKRSTFNDTENFRNLYDYDDISFRHHHYYNSDYNEHKYLSSPNCKIVWDDVNHTSYRVIKNGKFIKDKNKCGPKHFKINNYG